MKKLRVGFLVDSLNCDHYVNQLITFVAESEAFESPVLITGYKIEQSGERARNVLSRLRTEPLKLLSSVLSAILYRLIEAIELNHARNSFPKYRICEPAGTQNECEIIDVTGSWSKSKLFLSFTESDISKIKQRRLDCIIRCGSGILRGEILKIAEFGVISFHHGDNRVNRGGPSGFWEVLNNEASSGFVIQKLNEELDGGKILFRGNVMTKDLWLENNALLLEKSNVFMKRLLLELAHTRALPCAEGVRLHGNKLYKIRSALDYLAYIITILVPKLVRSVIAKVYSPNVQRWSVAYSHHQNFSKSLWRYTEIKNPTERFLADPFVFENEEETHIFVEDLIYGEDKGRISAIRIDDDGHEFLGVVLEESFHLSFPFVFRDGPDIYMVPESYKNKDIRLYRCAEFPMRWEFETQLMSDVDAADTLLIKENDIWFMLTNICSAKINDHYSELHIFYTNDLKAEAWTPINSGNPVIFDPLKGRNAGIFCQSGKLYRVNQVQAKGLYGKAFQINEVVEISKEQYIEREVSYVGPNFKDSIISTHHFSAGDRIAAVDFARLQRKKTVGR